MNESDRVRCYSSHYDHIIQKLCPLLPCIYNTDTPDHTLTTLHTEAGDN